MEKIFIDFADFEKVVYWLGIPYMVESSFRGRFYNVLTLDEENVDGEIEDKVLQKYFTFKDSPPNNPLQK